MTNANVPAAPAILLVGDKEEISRTLPEHPMMLKELTSGPVKDVPPSDPLTMKPMAAEK